MRQTIIASVASSLVTAATLGFGWWAFNQVASSYLTMGRRQAVAELQAAVERGEITFHDGAKKTECKCACSMK